MRQRRKRTPAAPATAVLGALALTACGTGDGGDEVTAEDVQRVLVGDVDSDLTLTDRVREDEPALGANCEQNDDGFTCEFMSHGWRGDVVTSQSWASVEEVDVQTEESGGTVELTLSPVDGTLSSFGGIVDLDPNEEGGTALFDSVDGQQSVAVDAEALETEDDADERDPVSTDELEQHYIRENEESPTGFAEGFDQIGCESELEPTIGSFAPCVATREDHDPSEVGAKLPIMVYAGESEDGTALLNMITSRFSSESISEADELPAELTESDVNYEDVDVEPDD